MTLPKSPAASCGDLYFNPQTQRFKCLLKAFLQVEATRPSSIPIHRIEIHTGHESTGAKKFFHAECVKHLPSIIPRGMKIRLIRWNQNDLHNRFTLTEYGGLKFVASLDDHNDSVNTYNIVDLLESRSRRQKTWQEYQ